MVILCLYHAKYKRSYYAREELFILEYSLDYYCLIKIGNCSLKLL